MIKDTPFDIMELKSKRRYEINKGNKNFAVKEINSEDYIENLFWVTKAYEHYPEKYRPNLTLDIFKQWTKDWNKHKIWGAFSKEDNLLCGYAWCDEYNDWVDFCALKAVPEFERGGGKRRSSICDC